MSLSSLLFWWRHQGLGLVSVQVQVKFTLSSLLMASEIILQIISHSEILGHMNVMGCFPIHFKSIYLHIRNVSVGLIFCIFCCCTLSVCLPGSFDRLLLYLVQGSWGIYAVIEQIGKPAGAFANWTPSLTGLTNNSCQPAYSETTTQWLWGGLVLKKNKHIHTYIYMYTHTHTLMQYICI